MQIRNCRMICECEDKVGSGKREYYGPSVGNECRDCEETETGHNEGRIGGYLVATLVENDPRHVHGQQPGPDGWITQNDTQDLSAGSPAGDLKKNTHGN